MKVRSAESPQTPTPSRRTRPGGLRIVLIAASFVLLVRSLADLRSDFGRRSGLVGEARTLLSEDGREDVVRRIRNARSGRHAELALARALVYQVAGGKSTDPALLGRARELAREALQAQPSSWLGCLILGASTYLERQLAHDRRLITSAEDWQQPLLRAMHLAPGQPEPRRFLAAAYLEVWPHLPEPKRMLTRKLLTEAFRSDSEAFARLLPAWLAVARDVDEAFVPIPDQPQAWERLERTYAELGRWDAFCRARGRRLDALEAAFTAELAEADRRLRLGDHFGGRSLLLGIVSRAPREMRFAPFVTRALEHYPAGLHGLGSTARLGAWLRWGLDLHRSGQDPLTPLVLSRLAGVAGDVGSPDRALAALIGGEVHHAEQLERQTDRLTLPAWSDYLIAKARWLLDRGQPEEARATLNLVARVSRHSLTYVLARERVDLALGDLVDLPAVREQLAELRRAEWSALAWRHLGAGAQMEILPEAGARGFAVELLGVPDDGAVVTLLWDGDTVALEPVAPGAELVVEVEIEDRPHLLELRVLAGGAVQPGRVRLLPNP